MRAIAVEKLIAASPGKRDSKLGAVPRFMRRARGANDTLRRTQPTFKQSPPINCAR